MTVELRIAEARMPEHYNGRVEQTNLMDIDPDKLTPAQLGVIAQHLIEKALGDSPEAVAEARQRLEAGESVTVEGIFQDVTEGQEPEEPV